MRMIWEEEEKQATKEACRRQAQQAAKSKQPSTVTHVDSKGTPSTLNCDPITVFQGMIISKKPEEVPKEQPPASY